MEIDQEISVKTTLRESKNLLIVLFERSQSPGGKTVDGTLVLDPRAGSLSAPMPCMEQTDR